MFLRDYKKRKRPSEIWKERFQRFAVGQILGRNVILANVALLLEKMLTAIGADQVQVVFRLCVSV